MWLHKYLLISKIQKDPLNKSWKTGKQSLKEVGRNDEVLYE